MTIAGRFAAALSAAECPETAGPELLPVRLARAATTVLGVDGSGLSLLDASGQRTPLGADSGPAATAERLQFTVGIGPCLAAQQTGQPVLADGSELRRRWAPYADLLVGTTPYRAVVALPVRSVLDGTGAIDLYFRCSADLLRLDVFEGTAVAALVGAALDAAAEEPRSAGGPGPAWLRGRTNVWAAVGVVAMELELDAPLALSVLRARAYATGRTVDDLAADVLTGRLPLVELELGAAQRPE